MLRHGGGVIARRFYQLAAAQEFERGDEAEKNASDREHEGEGDAHGVDQLAARKNLECVCTALYT